MPNKHQPNIEQLVNNIKGLTDSQMYWLEQVVSTFKHPHKFQVVSSDLITNTILNDIGDGLRIHHSFSLEPFTKDKFEYLLDRILNFRGIDVELAPKGNRGHDIVINNKRVSLKTQADKNIRSDKIWISKFMELGKGKWGDKEEDLVGLRNLFLEHLKLYDRIFILRALSKAPKWLYELVEIPTTVLKLASKGTLKMMHDSKQFPKPGYCFVNDKTGDEIFKLYFDGGRENKLQIKGLDKKVCKLHATWEFDILD